LHWVRKRKPQVTFVNRTFYLSYFLSVALTGRFFDSPYNSLQLPGAFKTMPHTEEIVKRIYTARMKTKENVRYKITNATEKIFPFRYF